MPGQSLSSAGGRASAAHASRKTSSRTPAATSLLIMNAISARFHIYNRVFFFIIILQTCITAVSEMLVSSALECKKCCYCYARLKRSVNDDDDAALFLKRFSGENFAFASQRRS